MRTDLDLIADIIDAIDHTASDEVRIHAAIRAVRNDPEAAIVMATSLLHGMLAGLAATQGDAAAPATLAAFRRILAEDEERGWKRRPDQTDRPSGGTS